MYDVDDVHRAGLRVIDSHGPEACYRSVAKEAGLSWDHLWEFVYYKDETLTVPLCLVAQVFHVLGCSDQLHNILDNPTVEIMEGVQDLFTQDAVELLTEWQVRQDTHTDRPWKDIVGGRG